VLKSLREKGYGGSAQELRSWFRMQAVEQAFVQRPVRPALVKPPPRVNTIRYTLASKEEMKEIKKLVEGHVERLLEKHVELREEQAEEAYASWLGKRIGAYLVQREIETKSPQKLKWKLDTMIGAARDSPS
jgi:hypothetical protein